MFHPIHTFLRLSAFMAFALFLSSCHEKGKSEDVEYVPCGDGQFCEVVEFEGVSCYLMPCGEDTCLVCPEKNDEKPVAISSVSPEELTVSEVLQNGVIFITNYQAPTSMVTLHAVSQNDRIHLEPAQLTISPENWDDVQSIHVSCTDDGSRNGELETNIVLTYESEDAQYASLPQQTVHVRCLDDGADHFHHIVVTKYGTMETTEGGKSVKIGIRLDQQPDASVYVHASSSDNSEGIVSPETITFGGQDYDIEQFFTVSGVNDTEVDGKQTYQIEFTVESRDEAYSNISLHPIEIVNRDDDDSFGAGVYPIRFMAANITSGPSQSYDEGHGIRIFQALKPDIVLIQEFNYGDNSEADITTFVHDTFGEEYTYYRGQGGIPNGVISRYPIIDSGGWKSGAYNDRRWEWALIDIPGSKDLLAVSLHLHTDDNTQEMSPLLAQIKSKMNLDGEQYYLVAGGDFNTAKRATVAKKFEPTFSVSTTDYPVDQNGNGNTNAKRANPYDWVIFSPDLEAFENEIVIGKHTYPHGHVFDSRVYGAVKGYKCSEHGGANELGDVPPVLSGDSGASQMQHMAVIRDVALVVK